MLLLATPLCAVHQTSRILMQPSMCRQQFTNLRRIAGTHCVPSKDVEERGGDYGAAGADIK
jgi:hypothetical protein